MVNKKNMVVALCVIIGVIALTAITEFLMLTYRGTPVAAPNIPRTAQKLGTSTTVLTYVVMGDSTSIGQGAPYKDSYSYQSAQHLAKKYQVSLINVGVSGAQVHDVKTKQLKLALAKNPDIVLLAIGANDVTHLTSAKDFEADLQAIIDGLRRGNCDRRIVVTGVPAMGSVDRFPFLARKLAGIRTNQLNDVYKKLIISNQLAFAPVAQRTGPAFAADPTLFAADKFHPNARGYALWTPVVNQGLDDALSTAPKTCL